MKTLRIAFQSLKRLVFNPIMMTVLLIAIIISISVSFFFSPVITEGLTLAYSTSSLTEMYENFIGGSSVTDSKADIISLIEENEQIFSAQHTQTYLDEFNDLKDNSDNTDLKALFERAKLYYSNQNMDSVISKYDTDVEITEKLASFVEDINSLSALQTSLYITNSQYNTISSLSTALSEAFDGTASTDSEKANAYATAYNYYSLYEEFDSLTLANPFFNSTTLSQLQTTYITNAKAKLEKIEAEITALSSQKQDSDTLAEMASLIYNYKYQAIQANNGLKAELQLLILNHDEDFYNELYNLTVIPKGELKTTIQIAQYVLAEDSLYYSDYLTAMQFNSAIGDIDAYDVTYTLITLVGFVMVALSIYFAYRLFGEDRRNGKMDMVLTQNVTFGNVFTGNFLAIVMSTLLLLCFFFILFIYTGVLMYGISFSSVIAVFNLTTAYTISPILYLIIKLLCIELEVVFYSILTIFLMNISRKFSIMLIIAYAVFVLAFIGNTLLSGVFAYTLLPFAHINLFSYFGGATSTVGLFNTMFIASGNFYISIIYYLVITIAFYSFTNQLFRKN